MVLIGLGWLWFAFGCAGGPGGTGGEVRSILEPPYGGVGGTGGLGDSGVVRAGVLLPLAERSGRVVVTDAGEEHSAVNRTEAIPPPPELLPPPPPVVIGERPELSGAGVVEELPGAFPEGAVSRGVWRMSVGGWWVVDVTNDASGAVVILQEVEEMEARRVVYDPPLPMLPGELRMGEPIERSSNVSIYNNDSGALESTGTCTATYTLLGTKPLPPAPGSSAADPGSSAPGSSDPGSTPGSDGQDTDHDGTAPGSFGRDEGATFIEAGKTSGAEGGGGASGGVVYIIRKKRRPKLPLAISDTMIHLAYAPGEGPIAGHTVRVVKLLGLIPVRHEQRVERR